MESFFGAGSFRLVLVLGLVANLSISSRAENLISSGDFEGIDEGEAVVSGWSLPTGTVSVVKGSGPSGGEKVLYIDGSPNVSLVTEKIKVDPEGPLVISGWVKASGEIDGAAGAYVMLVFYDDMEVPLDRDALSPGRHSRNLFIYHGEDWKEFRREFIPVAEWSTDGGRAGLLPLPAAAAYFELKLTNLGYTKEVWFDDLVAEQE